MNQAGGPSSSSSSGIDYRALQFNAFQNDNAAGSFSFNRGMTQGPVATQPAPFAGHGVASLLLGYGVERDLQSFSRPRASAQFVRGVSPG